MKKEKGKRPPVPRYFPMNRDHSATGFSPQGCKPPQSKSPPLRGATGDKHRRKLPNLFISRHYFVPLTLNPYTLNPFPSHRRSTENPIQQFNKLTIQLSPTTDLHRKNEKGKMKKEKGKRPSVPRYFPMNRDHSATGFSPQGHKPPHTKCPFEEAVAWGGRIKALYLDINLIF